MVRMLVEVGRLMALPDELEAGGAYGVSGVEVPIPGPMAYRELPQTADISEVFLPLHVNPVDSPT